MSRLILLLVIFVHSGLFFYHGGTAEEILSKNLIKINNLKSYHSCENYQNIIKNYTQSVKIALDWVQLIREPKCVSHSDFIHILDIAVPLLANSHSIFIDNLIEIIINKVKIMPLNERKPILAYLEKIIKSSNKINTAQSLTIIWLLDKFFPFAAEKKNGYINEIWRNSSFTDAQWRAFLDKYTHEITEASHLKNLQRLLLQQRFKLFEEGGRYIHEYENKSKIRHYFLYAKGDLDRKYFDDFTSFLKVNKRDNRDSNNYKIFLEILNFDSLPKDFIWLNAKYLARKSIQSKKYSNLAYKILNKITDLSPDDEETRLFLMTRLLMDMKKPEEAQKILGNLASSPAISVATKAHYWLGRLSVDSNIKKLHYKIAAEYPFLFYGQLAIEELSYNLDHNIKTKLNQLKSHTCDLNESSDMDSIVNAGILFHELKHNWTAHAFFETAVKNIKDPHKGICILKKIFKNTSTSLGYDIGILAAKQNYPLLEVSYPIPYSLPPLILALIRQESKFNSKTVSSKRAIGLMQLLESTAQETAKRLNIPYSGDRLAKDDKYNIMLGSAYLSFLIEYYGNVPMALGAYNAGFGKVKNWKTLFKIDENNLYSMLDWLESIEYEETRNYITNIMAAKNIYRSILVNK